MHVMGTWAIQMLVFLCELSSHGSAVMRDDVLRLKAALLEGYVPEEIPVRNLSNRMTIYVDFTLKSVQSFDEVSGELKFSGVVNLRWKDEFIQWQPSQYGNITSIGIPVNKVWVPNIMLSNAAEYDQTELLKTDYVNYKVQFSPYGDAIMFQGGILNSVCEPDILKYPFDQHHCHLMFMAFGMRTDEAVFKLSKNKFDDFLLSKNGAWEIDSGTPITTSIYTIPFFRYTIILTRRPMFILMYMLLPISIFVNMNVFSFLLPPDSGERISFSITTLLSLIVSLTIVAANLPPTSYPTAYVGYLFAFDVLTSSLITVFVIIQKNLFHKEDKVSRCADRFTKFLLRKDQNFDVSWPSFVQAMDRVCICAFLVLLVFSKSVYFIYVMN